MIWLDEFFPPALLDFPVITKYFNHTLAHSISYLNDEIGFIIGGIAEFRIELDDSILHVRYFTVRDAKGFLHSTLEVSREVTAIRKLEGQRRLLGWEY